MKLLFPILLALTAPIALAAPGLTIYNQNFAVVRDTLPPDLSEALRVGELRFAVLP
jgi:hypothetical protein